MSTRPVAHNVSSSSPFDTPPPNTPTTPSTPTSVDTRIQSLVALIPRNHYDDAFCYELRKCRSISSLVFSPKCSLAFSKESNISDAELYLLLSCNPQLNELEISSTKSTNTALDHIARCCPKLIKLSLSAPNISRTTPLLSLFCLRELSLYISPSADIGPLDKLFPITSIDMQGDPFIHVLRNNTNGQPLKCYQRQLNAVRTLLFSSASNCTDAELSLLLPYCPNLTSLSIISSQATMNVNNILKKRCPKARSTRFYLTHITDMNDLARRCITRS